MTFIIQLSSTGERMRNSAAFPKFTYEARLVLILASQSSADPFG